MESAVSHATERTSAMTDRLSHFLSENKRAVILSVAGAAVLAGGAYYLYSAPPKSSSKPDPPEGARKKTKKAKKAKSSARSSPPLQTPADSEEKEPSLDAAERGVSKSVQEVEDPNDPLRLTSAQIEALDASRRQEVAGELKTRGNKAYAAKKYSQAIALYSKAIQCQEQAVFYSNRAACYSHLNDLQSVIKDCTDALRLDPTYVKALNRRAAARESLGKEQDLFGSLCDYTAAAIIDQFQTRSTSEAVDRVMKRLSGEQALEMMRHREPRMPSGTFVKAYLDAFRQKDDLPLPENPSTGDETFQLALGAVKAHDYLHALSLVGEAIEQGITTDAMQARAYNMRGTFRFIMGNPTESLADLDKSTDLDRRFVQTWVKKASVHMELGQPDVAFADFDTAERIDPSDPDVYYHRGQVHFITGKYTEAIEQYKKSTELDSTFIFSQIQHAVALYKDDRKEKADAKFKKLIKTLGEQHPEIHNYYGELLLDQSANDPSMFGKALASFDRAIDLDTKLSKDSANVLPLVNKGLCIYQSAPQDKERVKEAEELVKEALRRDPGCDVGVATLAQLYLQANKIYDALAQFERSAELARTEMELVNAMTYLNATKAQIYFVETYPSQAAAMGLAVK